jgi:hypothetical protein
MVLNSIVGVDLVKRVLVEAPFYAKRRIATRLCFALSYCSTLLRVQTYFNASLLPKTPYYASSI